ncbi:heparinase II/III-family protein [Paenibacillus sp. HWE-109]|uniref:heparinase II/III domain-containing protein n=1 Tax=Paenibacillus sp. HWE-109 TaxID=1306526 RepID=UPI001EDF8615|nr:heparinase II/III family protein [Paenibacillus sp. HWE-109]UKS24731.1 heparinase II/III-family protein [Paenibacillus sp. HWE-109]
MDTKRLKQLQTNASKAEFAEAMALLRQEAEEAEKITYQIRSQEQGQWTHYYHCDVDGSRLTFAWDQPFLHRCPSCGKERSGEPFNAAWISIAHSLIGRAIYHIALLYAIEPDVQRLAIVKSYLMAYASHYETYQTHGDIPYNGPGKLFAQTLDEAHWMIDLAMGFDVIQEHLTLEEETHIRSGLLVPCARFLIAHKEKQIHNHSVLITSAIAAIGLLLNDDEIVQAGLEGEYGLHDQLERGIYEDGLWYEGNMQYHFYAFKSLLHYALIAEGTQWDIWNRDGLKAMFDYPLHFVLPDGAMPTLNDAGLGDSIGSYTPYYEIALDIYGDAIYRSLLNTAYGTEWADKHYANVKTVRRNSVYGLMFGQPLEPTAESRSVVLSDASHRTSSFPASGLSKLVHSNGWQAIVKHSRFGGEHDHMDRLGLSVICGSVPLLVDPGTTAYGIPAHYGWFKHTYSHNTVSINGADQPPRDGRIVQLEEQPWGTWIETAVDWLSDDFQMKNQIILPPELSPWDVEAYGGTQIRRINVLADNHLLDIVQVSVPQLRDVHWMNHVSGLLREHADTIWEITDEPLGRLEQKWLKDKRKLAAGPHRFSYQMREGVLEQASWCSLPVDIYMALTPDNPPSSDRTSLIQRVAVQGTVLFIQAVFYEAHREFADEQTTRVGQVSVTACEDETYQIEWVQGGNQQCYELTLKDAKAKLRKFVK